MKNLNDQLKEQGLINSFGQPLDSSNLEADCVACTNCITGGCIDCTVRAPSC